ncbi:hypothetical protein WL80_04210 [Burkholderia ubonensis]|nr:hypothetical protein WL80_04210 [Burkholderia ubonensis]
MHEQHALYRCAAVIENFPNVACFSTSGAFVKRGLSDSKHVKIASADDRFVYEMRDVNCVEQFPDRVRTSLPVCNEASAR